MDFIWYKVRVIAASAKPNAATNVGNITIVRSVRAVMEKKLPEGHGCVPWWRVIVCPRREPRADNGQTPGHTTMTRGQLFFT